MIVPLDIGNTVAVEELRHRLLLGIAVRDATTGGTALGPIVATLESLGPYKHLDIALDAHGAARHALRYAGLASARLRAAVAAHASTAAVVRIESPGRQHVPRRLQFSLVLDGDRPKLDPPTVNVRNAWLWPGVAHAMPPTATVVRGRVAEGPDLDHATPVPWARVFAAIPDAEANFANAAPVGCAHADDRGEYVLAITQDAYAGASLSRTADVRLWAFRAPVMGPPDPADPLAGLGAEDAGVDALNDVLRGNVVPAGYAISTFTKITLRAGDIRSGDDTALLFT